MQFYVTSYRCFYTSSPPIADSSEQKNQYFPFLGEIAEMQIDNYDYYFGKDDFNCYNC